MNVIPAMQTLTDESFNRVVNGHNKNGYILISSQRNENTNEENNNNNRELKKKISDLHYSYIPVYGGFIETNDETGEKTEVFESSLMAFPYNTADGTYADFDVFFNDMVNIGKYYNQESILVKAPDAPARYYNLADGTYDEPFSDVLKINDIAQKYFTALTKYKNKVGSPHRFTYTNENYMNADPNTMHGLHMRGLKGELCRFSDRNK